MNPRLRTEWVVLSEELCILSSCFLSPMSKIDVYCRPCRAKNRRETRWSGANFGNLVARVPTVFANQGQICCVIDVTCESVPPAYASGPNFIRIDILCRSWEARDPRFDDIFMFNFMWWRHLEIILNTTTHLQTVHYPSI